MGKKNQAQLKKVQEQERRRAERAESTTTRKAIAKERRKRHYNRAEDKEWQTNFDKFSLQLKTQGLMIHDVAGDGNCLFRSIADQLYGDAARHVEVRQQIMDHIEKNPDNFAPFIEDDEPFEKYVKSMRKSGTWGGNIELQAASVLFGVNVNIYQLGQPRWDVVNHPPTARTILLSYHEGEHYNSVKPLPAAAAAATVAPIVSDKPPVVSPAKKAAALDKAARSRQFKEQAKEMARAGATAAGHPADDEPTDDELALMQALDIYDLPTIRAMMAGEDTSAASSASVAEPIAAPATPAPASSATSMQATLPLMIPEDENEQLALALSLSAASGSSDATATASLPVSETSAQGAKDSKDSTELKEQKDSEEKNNDEEDEAERARRQHEKNMAKLAAKSGHMSNQRRKQIQKQEKEKADKDRKRERQLAKAEEKQLAEKAIQLGIAPAALPPGVPLEAFQTMRI